ncbi:TonB-dependent receptor [Phenylobacterium sp.]|uniref:TonB-dependent receptor n=1 Tax=Phenylobacterium sp. TaxID=1871053 RepID=UPI001212DA4E|nr:TonB-dependent receptor [Phenylobacterium sp.]THD61285.1 MAG: TonB-dependent receptor [Phenylobacterium sp.]
MKTNRKLTAIALLSSTALSLALAAHAEGAAADGAAADDSAASVSEVIVTAQKRSSTVQDTPISISAVSGNDLQARGVTNFANLAQSTPSVSLKSEGPGQTEIELRGMTSSGGNSATVGFYLDDIPLTAPAGAQNGKVVIDPTLYDLNRVEVLRGPQGTLYGAGSMGGTVRLITNQPDPTGFHASAQSILSATEGGSFNHTDNFMLNIPLVQDKLALRLVGTEAYTSGWIDRIVAAPGDFPLPSADGSTRGNVQAAPVQKDYKGANDEQAYAVRATLLWQPTDQLTITPSFFYQTSKQDGISAYDSDPGTMAHYQPFDIAEPLTDRITTGSLTVNYDFDPFSVTSSTAYWSRRSTQVEDGSEDFNNPNTGATFASNNGLPNPGYYGPNGSGMVSGKEDDPSHQFSEELRFASRGEGKLKWVGGAFYSDFSAVWNFDGTTSNPSAYMDLGTFAPATTTAWFVAKSPTHLVQYAVFGEATYDITDQLKATVGLRWYSYDYQFSSSISGWGSGLGAATPSVSGLIRQSADGFNPKFNLEYKFDSDLMVYATIAKGFRPGGGNAVYPVTGPYWSAVFAPYNFPGGKWPTSYQPDSVWSFEVGEKARFFDRRLIVNASLYYEDWENIQLEALPGDWALNINGNKATIYGGELEGRAILGGGFQLDASLGLTNAWVDPGPHWQITPSNKLSDVAPVNGNVGLSYSKDLTAKYAFNARIESAYVGQRYSLAFPFGFSLNGKYVPLPGYDLTNLRAGITSTDGWGAAVFANNIFNKHAQLESLFQETLPSASFNRIVTNQPLTAGVDLTYRF